MDLFPGAGGREFHPGILATGENRTRTVEASVVRAQELSLLHIANVERVRTTL